MRMDNQMKKCFVITPIGKSDSITRRKIDGLIKEVIRPVVGGLGFEVIVSHEINESGTMTSRIIKEIYNCELVIANLTGNNPNVMYEVALRHASSKPIIHITENISELPFDINDQRTIEYTDDMWGTSDLKERLQLMIQSIEFNKPASNPITEALEKKDLLNIPTGTSIDFETFMLGIKDDIKMMRKELNRNKVMPDYNKIAYECIRPYNKGMEYLADMTKWTEEKYGKFAKLSYDEIAIKIEATDSLERNAHGIIADIREVIGI